MTVSVSKQHTLLIAMLLAPPHVSNAFLPELGAVQVPHRLMNRKQRTSPNLFWFGGKDQEEKKRKKEKGLPDVSEGASGMGSTASMMESFKAAQEVGKRTAALTQELSSTTIEGSSSDGRVKCYMDGQQRPMGVEIDEGYLSNVSAEDLNDAITKAMQDAHSKSIEKMEERMQDFYSEIGLPTAKS